MTTTVETPFLVALNLTRRCNLKCAHCYLDAGTLNNDDPDELATSEVCALLNEIASLSDETMVVLTGGEPLLRPDIMDIAAHASGLGLMVVMGTNGVLLNDKRVDPSANDNYSIRWASKNGHAEVVELLENSLRNDSK